MATPAAPAAPVCPLCARGSGLRQQSPEGGAGIGLLIGAGLNADVAGTVIGNRVVHRIGGGGCSRFPASSAPPDRLRPSLRVPWPGSRRSGAPVAPVDPVGPAARGSGGSRRARGSGLRQQSPEARTGIGLLDCARLNADVAGTVVGNRVVHRIGGGGVPGSLPVQSRRTRWRPSRRSFPGVPLIRWLQWRRPRRRFPWSPVSHPLAPTWANSVQNEELVSGS